MTRISVQGLGVVGGFGTGLADLEKALVTGESPRSVLTVPTGKGPVEMPAFRADTSLLKEFVPARSLRRMDPFTKMGLLAAHLALADAGIASSEGQKQEGLGVIIASGFGATTTTFALLDSVIADGDSCASPTHFANSLHNACAANISIGLGATGPNLTVSQFGLSVPSALLTARQWLLDGRVDRVLFGAVDELSDLVGYLWYRKRGLPGANPIRPLATQTESAIPGEGAAFMVLSRSAASAGYCSLESVATGREWKGWANGSPGLLILSADGRKELGSAYAATGQGSKIACFTPLYGSLPAGPAFDLAIAALMLRGGKAYRTPAAEACDFNAVVAAEGTLDEKRIGLLTLDGPDGFGVIGLASN